MTAQPEDQAPDTVIYGGQEFQAAPTRKRGRETVRDMVISMGVVALGVAALLLVAWRPTPEAGVKTVDWRPVAVGARASAEFPVVTPVGLSDAWQATSVRFQRTPDSLGRMVWHLGFVTPGVQYAGVEQTDADPALFVPKALAGARPEGEVSIGGQQWQMYGTGTNGYRSLVRSVGQSTVIVTGSADQAELQALAASLAAAP